MDQINTLPWHPEVVVFGVNEDPFDFSCEVFDYGQARDLWNDEVLLVSFEDNPEAMAVSPYLYARGIPVLMLSEGCVNKIEQKDIMQFRALVLGEKAEVLLAQSNVRFTTQSNILLEAQRNVQSNDAKVKVEKCGYEVVQHNQDDRFIVLSALCANECHQVFLGSATHWFDLQSAGSAIAHSKGCLLLVDETQLGSIQAALDYLAQHKSSIESLVFIGDGLAQSGLDERVFCSRLC